MSIHPSLRKDTKDKQQRSVLKRIERVNKLMDEEKWQDDNVFSLPKIKTVKLKIKKEKTAEAAAVTTAGAPGAPGAAPAAGSAAAQPAGAAGKAKETSKSKPEAKGGK